MKKQNRGKFIAIEGIDGSGKTTLVRYLQEEMNRRGHFVNTYRQPGGTPTGDAVRKLFNEESVSDKTAALLIYAARTELMQNCIAPDINRGTHVICDRHTISTAAYQGNNAENLNFVYHLHDAFIEGVLKPLSMRVDLWVFMDVEPEVAFARIRSRPSLDNNFVEKQSDEKLKESLYNIAANYRSIFYGYDRQPSKAHHAYVDKDTAKIPKDEYYSALAVKIIDNLSIPTDSLTIKP